MMRETHIVSYADAMSSSDLPDVCFHVLNRAVARLPLFEDQRTNEPKMSCVRLSGLKVVAFLEPRAPERSDGRGEVIEKILHHCGLWQASAPRAPPDVEGLVRELDAAYSGSAIGSPDQADESQELTYDDIDTFLASF